MSVVLKSDVPNSHPLKDRIEAVLVLELDAIHGDWQCEVHVTAAQFGVWIIDIERPEDVSFATFALTASEVDEEVFRRRLRAALAPFR